MTETKQPRHVTQKLGRPKIRTEEEVIKIRNEISLNCYYKKREERIQYQKNYYESHKEEILKKRAERNKRIKEQFILVN